MDAGDDYVHLGQDFIGEVQGPVSEDVDLDAGEDADAALHLLLDLADALDVGEGALVVESVGHGQVLGVVGDGDVLIASGDGRFGHLADGVAAIGGGGVHVDVAADVGLLDESGNGSSFSSFDFAVVLAEFGGNPLEAEGLVDIVFGGSGYDGAVIDAGQGVLVERVAALEGALADGYVVGLGAGEVLEGGSVGGLGQESDIDLQTIAEVEADLVLALGDEVHDGRIGGGVLDGGGHLILGAGGAGDKDVEVAAGFAAPAEGAGGLDGVEAGKALEVVDKLVGGGLGGVDEEAAAVALVVLNAFPKLLNLLRAVAGEIIQASREDCCLKFFNRSNLKRIP